MSRRKASSSQSDGVGRERFAGPTRKAFVVHRKFLAAIAATSSFVSVAQPARAEASTGTEYFPFALPGAYHEIETKYIFGFTDGSDTGAEGETALESDTQLALRRRNGFYAAVEHEFEFEGVPSQFFAYELSVHGVAQSIKTVDGFDDRHQMAFGGLSTNLRYSLIARGPGNPIGLTVTAEPEWARIEGDTGQTARTFGSTFKLLADTELIENRLFLAANLIYAPEFQQVSGATSWSRAATIGGTSALAWRVSPQVTIGGEVEYYRAHDTLGFGAFQGHALYAGPTLHVQLTKKIMLAGAFSTQVDGHAIGDPRHLDLADFSRYRARLRLEVEF
jgi:hypothetical protein